VYIPAFLVFSFMDKSLTGYELSAAFSGGNPFYKKGYPPGPLPKNFIADASHPCDSTGPGVSVEISIITDNYPLARPTPSPGALLA
jgi:hypothetical protein